MNRSKNFKLFSYKTLILAIISLYVISLVKRVFVGYDIDEQYAVTLLYRVAMGDLPIKELWEPHQTSALALAPLVKAFIAIKGDTEYLMVFLRLVGALIQGLVAFLWYKVAVSKTKPWIAAFSAGIILFVLPKWIQSPEFANMQVWMLLATCLLLVISIEKNSFSLAVVAGVFFTLEVLSYPSCVLLVIAFVIILRKDLKKFAGLMIVPLISFVAFVGYLLLNMSVKELGYGVSHILSDGSHSDGFHDKITKYIAEVPQLAVHVLIYLLIGVIVSLLWRVFARKKEETAGIWATALCVSSAVGLLDQFRFWFSDGAHIVHPQYGYFVLFCAGFVFYLKDRSELKEKWDLWVKVMYGASFVGFLAVLMLTNLDIRASFVHLLPGMIMSVILFADWYESKGESVSVKVPLTILVASVSLLFLFGQMCVVRTSNEGRYDDIRLVRQKSLYGASKGIYCAYMEGFESNDNYLLLKSVIPDGSKVLYVGPNNLTYLMGSYVVCESNTISTPVYVGLEDYYGFNLDKRPDYMIVEKNFTDKKGVKVDDIVEMAGCAQSEKICESEFVDVFRLSY